jgi:hypothetical protein
MIKIFFYILNKLNSSNFLIKSKLNISLIIINNKFV